MQTKPSRKKTPTITITASNRKPARAAVQLASVVPAGLITY